MSDSMYCCPHCFKDSVAQNLIRDLAGSDKGDCSFCGAKNVPIYELSPECELSEQFSDLISVFAPAGAVGQNDREGDPLPFYEALRQRWDLFSFREEEKIHSFIKCLLTDDPWFERLLKESVVVSPGHGDKPIGDYRLFKAGGWDDFADEIMHRSRFHASLLNEDVLQRLLGGLVTTLRNDEDDSLVRGRIWTEERVPKVEDLQEPPVEFASDGRMSCKGIPCLYLADSVETSAAEVRAGVHDELAVIKVPPRKQLKVIDLAQIDRMSPFCDAPCDVMAVNLETLKRIKRELMKPVRTGESTLEYLPTQYLSDCIKCDASGYAGISYPSVMHEGGTNYAMFSSMAKLFDTENAKIDIYQIDGISYRKHKTTVH